jgi:hypothetical protein
MSTTIGRDHMVDLVVGDRCPFAVYLDFVVIADHAALSRTTVHEVTARAFAVISVQLRVEALMPFIVACPVISFLRRCAYAKKRGERTADKRYELTPRHPKYAAASVRAQARLNRAPIRVHTHAYKSERREPDGAIETVYGDQAKLCWP